ncbi:MAG: glycosyltransferase [Chloroflexia bacterium]
MTRSNAPLVSVIIPAFNSREWLAQAIDSALSQTYPNIEIVVVNDGSTDLRTREIAHRYIPRITYIERENGGVAAARNTGVAASTGELIALLDQDDVWLRHKLEVEVRAWLARPHVSLVHSSYHILDGQKPSTSAQRSRKQLLKLREREYLPLPGLLIDVPICSATTLFPRNILDEVGMFDPALNGTDDWDLWLRMAARGYTFYCVGEPLAEYRMHASNSSHNIDLMVGGVMRTLDKFYALPSVPRSALRWQKRAYFKRHTWAASLYYGAGSLVNAQKHLQTAARYLPHGIATGRFLQSLVHANHQAGGPPPGEADIHKASFFVRHALAQARIPLSTRQAVARRVITHKKLLLALHARRPLQLAATLLSDPTLIVDPELWAALPRRISRLLQKILIRTIGRRPTPD